MDAIINEVELKKKQRESQKIAALKASGKKDAEIQAILAKKPAKDVVLPKNQYDIQKMKLERLMKNPEKPVELPGPRKEWKPRDAPEFIRHVMGSSAGAGSGEFHVYRGIRRRENRRQAFLEKQYEKEQLDAQFKGRMEENKQKANENTAKKRAKRQKKKQKKSLAKRKKPSSPAAADDGSARSVSGESENDDDVRSENGDDVKSENGDDVKSENDDDVKSENGDDVKSENGDDVRSENGDDVRSENGDDVKSENDDDVKSDGEDETDE